MSNTRVRYIARPPPPLGGVSTRASLWNDLGAAVAVRAFIEPQGRLDYVAVADQILTDGGWMVLEEEWAGRTFEIYTSPGGALLLSFVYKADYITVTAQDPPDRAVLRCRNDRFTISSAASNICPA